MPSRRSKQAGRNELSRLLIELRGRSQTEAAQLGGLTQAKVSRAERAQFPLSPTETDDYARALGAAEDRRRQLVTLAEAAAERNIVSRAGLVRSARALQERFGQLEREASLIRSWQPQIVPGVLQTEAYTLAVVGGEADADWWAVRAARRAELRTPGRTWHQLVSEGALRWPLASPTVMAEQLRALIEANQWPGVRLGILDFGQPKPMAPPPAFHLYDGHTAAVATEVGTSFVTDERDLKHFGSLFRVARRGGAARRRRLRTAGGDSVELRIAGHKEPQMEPAACHIRRFPDAGSAVPRHRRLPRLIV